MKLSALIITTIILNFSILDAQSFLKISGDPAVSDGRYCEGSSWGDINNDGYLDLFVPHLHLDRQNVLFINNGDGSFREVLSGPVVTDQSRSTGGNFADFDNDGDLDLFVCNYFSIDNFLYLNNGDGTFTKVTEGIIVNDGGLSFGSSVADYDNDGSLDIFVVNGFLTQNGQNNSLYRNNGDATFTKITSGDIVTDSDESSASSWCDFDNDGDVDLFVANAVSTNEPAPAQKLYRNNGDGTFGSLDTKSIGIQSGLGSNGGWADYDNDGDFDLYVTNFLGENNMLYVNNGDGTFTPDSTIIISNDGGDSVSSAWADLDNDGDLDVYVTNDFNENNILYINDGNGSFTKITTGGLVSDGGRSNGATWADYDNDGDTDLYVPNGQRPAVQNNILYRNENASTNAWVNIKCAGTLSNKSAIGTKVKVLATTDSNPTWQMRQVTGESGFNAQNSLNVEFGLGSAARIDSLVIFWPSKQVDVYTNVAVNQFYSAIEATSLEQIIITSVQEPQSTPETFSLLQNYPNPFNPSTTIAYNIPGTGHVELKIYDILSKEVRTLVRQIQNAGQKSVVWDGKDNAGRFVTSGLYFYELRTTGKKIVKKMLLLK